jgi:hypothetical protein
VPQLSAWLIRAALLYLGTGFTAGMLMLWNKGVPLSPGLWRLLPLHIEFLLLGWTLQLAMGVAYWILPRFFQTRGNVPLAVAAGVLLNLGVLAVGLGGWLGAPGAVILLGRLAELLAAAAFALHAWPRVKPMGR